MYFFSKSHFILFDDRKINIEISFIITYIKITIYIFINYFKFFFQFSWVVFTKLPFLIEETSFFIKDK